MNNEDWRAIGLGQAQSIALSFIMTEMLADMARSQPDPDQYLSTLLNRVNSILDGKQAENLELSDVNIRAAIKQLMSAAESRLH